ncbi:MAG: AMP-binding protein, partial [Chloroflexi bacterium]|nr:AMP-binding protein [Chloroflexota bacterium]
MSAERGARNPDSVSFLNLWPGLFLARSARVWPEKLAVVYGDRSYSYSEFDARVERLAGALVANGVEAGDRVAYLVPNVPEMLEGHYGPMRMGAVLVAINTRLSSREVGYIVRHSGAKALVFDSEYADVVEAALGGVAPGVVERLGRDLPSLDPSRRREVQRLSGDAHSVQVLVEVVDESAPEPTPASGLFGAVEYENFLSSGEGVELPEINRNELDTVAIDYTSGTTGEPKGVEYTGRGTYLNALSQVVDAGLNSSSAYLWTLPMFHCNGWCFPWAVTAVGGTHICLRRVVAEDV